MQNKIKVFALGGLDENGKNLYCFDINGDIIVVECGLKYPESQNLGIDIEIPTFDYLIDNANRVKGIFLTHAHYDAIGALPYLIKDLNVPIFTSHLTAWIVEDRLKEANIKDYHIFRVNENAKIKLSKNITINPFKTTHSLIQSLGVSIETPSGNIIFISDYIIDFGLSDVYKTDVSSLVEIAKKDALLLMTESIGAKKTGYTAPKHHITHLVENSIASAKGRIIVSAYTHSMYNIKEIVNLGIKYGYQIIFYNRELQDLIHKQEKLGYPVVEKKYITNIKNINNNNVMVIISGNGIDLFEKLSSIATKADDILKPKQSDTFIITSVAIPGVEHVSIKAIDDIYRLDSEVLVLNNKSITSMHASEEDLKFMINLFNPKYYMPFKGDYIDMIANADIALKMGISEENIIVMENGQVASFYNGRLEKSRDRVPCDSMLIDGQTVNDNNGVVLSDRMSLSNEGTIIIGIGLDKKHQEMPIIDVQTRGFIYIKDSEYIIENIRIEVEKLLSTFDFKNHDSYNDAKTAIREKVSKYINKETGKKPIVLSMITTY
ncbi:MAG: ribonuclease J [Bacilli bacterium]|jgi:ribonuclease J|nr:ribonuclease J [Bacilli bacterium]